MCAYGKSSPDDAGRLPPGRPVVFRGSKRWAGGQISRVPEQGDPMLWLVLLIVIAFIVLGFFVKLLFIVAAIVALIWLVGFFVRSVEGARWYRW
jgi:hypothetical protein